MATVFGGDCIRIGAGGVPEIVFLTIEDDDRNLESGEAGVTWAIDGVTLAAAPATSFATATVTLLDGSLFGAGCITFIDGADTYIFGTGVDASGITSVGTITNNGAVGGTAYTSRDIVVGQQKVFIGDALVVVKDTGGATLATQVEQITVYDDDTRIQFDGTNGAPASEARGTPVAFLGDSAANVDFNRTDAGVGDTDLVLVEVDGLDGTGNPVTFEAIKYTFSTFFNGALAIKTFYIPHTGSVDPADVVSVTSETVLATSLDGELYRDFGLSNARTQTDGDAGDNLIEVGIGHDFLRGMGGADSLIGNIGEDRLAGGGGADLLFGGLHNDLLAGGAADDELYGGLGNDKADGGDGNDSAFGGWGNDNLAGDGGNDSLDGGENDDALSGGAGDDLVKGGDGGDVLFGGGDDDTLFGGGGDDALVGGTGADSLTGGSGDDQLAGGTLGDILDGGTGTDEMEGEGGADTFVLVADGREDTILDYQDGVDLIDVDANFAGLVITDIAAGEVQVTHNGDVLIVQDGLGLLVAADLTNADFI